jgi:hypothetical protein
MDTSPEADVGRPSCGLARCSGLRQVLYTLAPAEPIFGATLRTPVASVNEGSAPMVIISADLAVRAWQGVVMGVAVVAMIFGGFAMGAIDGVTVNDDHPPSDDESPDEGG